MRPRKDTHTNSIATVPFSTSFVQTRSHRLCGLSAGRRRAAAALRQAMAVRERRIPSLQMPPQTSAPSMRRRGRSGLRNVEDPQPTMAPRRASRRVQHMHFSLARMRRREALRPQQHLLAFRRSASCQAFLASPCGKSRMRRSRSRKRVTERLSRTMHTEPRTPQQTQVHPRTGCTHRRRNSTPPWHARTIIHAQKI